LLQAAPQALSCLPPCLLALCCAVHCVHCCRSGREPSLVETALNRALDAYYDGQEWWQKQLVPRVMRQDWSWSRSAADYLNIYRGMM
jgi:hypothetical protein